MTSKLFWTASAHLLLALFVTSYLATNGHVLAEDGGISSNEDTTRPETTSLQGKLRGVNMLTRRNRTIYGFKGIPFAEPPVGKLRFKAPVPAGSWTGTFDADKDSNLCPRTGNFTGKVKGDEDCLYLHVYTPTLRVNDNSTLLPVMVFIFGGGFKSGTNNPEAYGPDFLLDKDVVLVVPNYRLGVLGFLTTGDEVSPGNYGLKDIVRALEWNRDNIEYFGGDPRRVTLFGGSSGAMSVSYLTLSKSSNGLFHRYITQSGTALNMELARPTKTFVDRTIRMGEYLGCPTNTSTVLVNCLRGLSANEIVNTEEIFYEWHSIPNILWLPISTEPDIEGAFLTDSPTNLFAAGRILDVPSISLVVRDEGLVQMQNLQLYEDLDLFEEFMEKIDFVLPHMLGYSNSVDNVTAYTAVLKSYYLNDMTANRSVLLKNLTELIGDWTFYYPAFLVLQHQLAHTKSPAYYASFEYRGVFGNSYDVSGGVTNYTSVVHGDELIYLFENFQYRFGPSDYEYSEVDWSMVDIMVELWTSFAINGTPTIGDSNGTFVWEPYSSLNNYLRIGNGVNDTATEMKRDLYEERMQFWKQLYPTASGQCQNQLQLLTMALCLCVLSALHQRWLIVLYYEISDCAVLR